MPEDLRATVEAELADQLEGDWGVPVELANPRTGEVIRYSRNSPLPPLPPLLLKGQFISEAVRREDMVDTEKYGTIVTNKPAITLRKSSLPQGFAVREGEVWGVRILFRGAAEAYVIEGPPQNGDVYGIVTYFLKKAGVK